MEVEKPLFHPKLNQEVYKTGQIKYFTANTVIVDMDSYIRNIPIVLSGSIKVMQTDGGGQEILLYYIKPGESCIISILASINNYKSKIKAVVEEDAKILLIPVASAGEWIKQFPEWTDFIFKLYQKRFEELLQVVNNVAFLKLDFRLLHLLKQKSSLFNLTEIHVTHQQLANELGTTREAVSRVLKQLEKDGLIFLGRNKISLL